MLAPFRIFDGTLSAPGLAFTNETNLGFYRSAAGTMTAVSGGTAIWNFDGSKFTSLLRADFYGYTTYRSPGSYNWRVYDDNSGNYVIAPSTIINGDTYDLAKATWINPITGEVTVPKLTVLGLLTVGSFTFVNIECANLHTTGNMSADGNMSAGSMTCNQNIINANLVAGTAAINFATSQSWVMTLAANLTITSITGLAVGNIGRITFLGTGLYSITLPASVKWPGPTYAAPNFTPGPLKKVVLVLEWDGTHYLANAAVY
jgi:hypothetical protein